MVRPSTPGAPRLARTSLQALRMTSLRATLFKQGMKTTAAILLSTAVQHASESTNTIHARGAADGPMNFSFMPELEWRYVSPDRSLTGRPS
jgi:hypothetical protein